MNLNPTKREFLFFVRHIKKEVSTFEIGHTEDLLKQLEQLKGSELINVVRCSNYHELKKELYQTFEENMINGKSELILNPEEIESVNLIIRSKSQY